MLLLPDHILYQQSLVLVLSDNSSNLKVQMPYSIYSSMLQMNSCDVSVVCPALMQMCLLVVHSLLLPFEETN